MVGGGDDKLHDECTIDGVRMAIMVNFGRQCKQEDDYVQDLMECLYKLGLAPWDDVWIGAYGYTVRDIR